MKVDDYIEGIGHSLYLIINIIVIWALIYISEKVYWKIFIFWLVLELFRGIYYFIKALMEVRKDE